MASDRREFARLLRGQPTKAEDILWQCSCAAPGFMARSSD